MAERGIYPPFRSLFFPLRSRSSLTPFWFPVFIFEKCWKKIECIYIYLICNVSSRCKTPLGKRIPSCLFVVWKTVRKSSSWLLPSALIYSSSSVCFSFYYIPLLLMFSGTHAIEALSLLLEWVFFLSILLKMWNFIRAICMNWAIFLSEERRFPSSNVPVWLPIMFLHSSSF